MEGIEVEVYSYKDPTTLVDILDGRMEPKYLAELMGNGGGTIKINTNDPKIVADPTLLDYRNILKFKINGDVVGAIILKRKKASTIAVDGRAKEVYEITGESLKTWFDDADVKPMGGLRKASPNTRSFNFASERGDWYNSSNWVAPVIVAPVNTGPWGSKPTKWPTKSGAKWIWGGPYNAEGTAPSYSMCLFRYEFSTTSDLNHILYIAADDYVNVWVDGQQIVTTDSKTSAIDTATRVEFLLPSGSHVLAMQVSNKYGLTRNPAAMVASLYKMVNGVETLVSSSGSNGWLVMPFPTTIPGWSAGEVMLTLLNEAKARGVLFPTYLVPTFTSTTDSNGQAWGTQIDWTFDVGESLASVVSKLEELGSYIWVNPDTLELNITADRGIDRSVFGYGVDGISVTSTPVIFERGKNLRQADFEGVGKIKNSLTIKTEDGWMVDNNTDDASVGIYGVLESKLDTGASEGVSKLLANIVFAQRATPEEGATYEIIATDSIPFVDFNEGDWVLAPNEQNILVKRRVMSITLSESDSGQPLYAIEFDTIFQDNEARVNKFLGKSGGNNVGSSFSNASGSSTAGSPVVINTGAAPLPLPKAPDGLSATSVGEWPADGVSPYSEVTLTWNPVTANTDDTATVPEFYEVWGKLSSQSDDAYMTYAIVTTNQAIIQPFQPSSEWTFKVRALHGADQASSFSAEISHTMVGPNVALAAPTAPTLASNKGVLIVSWDGKLEGNITPPPQYRYVYALVSLDPNGPYNQMGAALLRDGRDINVTGLTIGNSYSVKLVAVDGVGLKSNPSLSNSITLTGIQSGDLSTEINQSISNANQKATDALAEAQAAGTTADGKNSIFFSPKATVPVGKVAGDLWWVLSDPVVGQPDTVIAVRIYNGINWLNYQVVADSLLVPSSVGTISLDDGVITAPKIVASEEMWTTVLGAHKILGDEVEAGTIKTTNLSADVGGNLDISANDSINLLVGQIDTNETKSDNLSSNLDEMQTYYAFGPDGAVISTPGSPFALALRNDKIEMLANGSVVSYWNSNQMYVSSFVGEQVVLGNHKLEKYGTGTVVRAL